MNEKKRAKKKKVPCFGVGRRDEEGWEDCLALKREVRCLERFGERNVERR